MLNNIYPGLKSLEFEAARNLLIDQISKIDNRIQTKIAAANMNTPAAILGEVVGEMIDSFNEAQELADTMGAYIYAFVSTNSQDALANRRLSEFEQITVKLKDCSTQFKAWIGSLGVVLDEVISANLTAHDHAFFLQETAQQSKYLMSKAEESLAAELSLSSAKSWEKLQGTITSQIVIDFEVDGKIQGLSLQEVINLHSHSNEEVRRRAYQAENSSS